jgi:hypothetical protein
MFGYAHNITHWPNMENIIHMEDMATEQAALLHLHNTREEIQDAAQDMLITHQQHMLCQNKQPIELKDIWKLQKWDQVWVMRHDANVPNPQTEPDGGEGGDPLQNGA